MAAQYNAGVSFASYAMRDEDTEGRRYPECPHPYRLEYQRDRDRIIHSKAFRRLEKKTQVFDPAYSDHFRNRLTHTIEVSQIARTVSEALGLNTDLCEVLALSHDIGHPPFSHTGEKVLDRIMKRYGSGFDHNLHALCIVEYFEEKYAALAGLNLTFEVREGIIKHSHDYEKGDSTYVDISEYRLGERPPLEAQLIDLADEIAYNSADLDDGYHSSLLPLEEILENCSLFRHLFERNKAQHAAVRDKRLVSETIRGVIDVLTTGLITHSRSVLETEGIDSLEKVRKFPRRLLGFDEEVARQNRELKQFLRRKLYDHKVIRKGRRHAECLLEELFDYYVQKPERLPESHQARARELPLHRVVCDYIAGMTDNYVRERHREIQRE